MKWYNFNQNNSGGSFVHTKDKLTHQVFIEAKTEKLANAIGEDLGIYFDGCSDGRDCSCCGDRWHHASEVKDLGKKTIEEYAQQWANKWGGFMGKLPECYIHYDDGRVVAIHKQPNPANQ